MYGRDYPEPDQTSERFSEVESDIRELTSRISELPAVVSVEEDGYDASVDKLAYKVCILERQAGVRVLADNDDQALTIAQDLFALAVGSLMRTLATVSAGVATGVGRGPAQQAPEPGPGITQRPFPDGE